MFLNSSENWFREITFRWNRPCYLEMTRSGRALNMFNEKYEIYSSRLLTHMVGPTLSLSLHGSSRKDWRTNILFEKRKTKEIIQKECSTWGVSERNNFWEGNNLWEYGEAHKKGRRWDPGWLRRDDKLSLLINVYFERYELIMKAPLAREAWLVELPAELGAGTER